MSVLPNRLKSLRKQLKITQSQVAQKANTTIANISGYESGKQTPSAGMLLRLSSVFGCSIDFLLGLTDDPNVDPGETNKAIPSEELISRYKIITEDGNELEQQEIEEMLEYAQVRRMMKNK